MKKYCILALAFVLTMTLFTGCRGKNEPTAPTRPTATDRATTPTAPSTRPTTEPTSEPTTTPTTGEIMPSDPMDGGMDEGVMPGNGGTPGENARGMIRDRNRR